MADRTRLVDRLRYERDARIDHALFYWTQVFMAYNSNHMEGSTLTPEQTRQIYDTGRLLADADEQIRLDDAIETRNHFTAFNYVIDHADDPVDAGYVCRLHALLKRGTSQDGDPGFNVGGYKTRDNAIVQRMGVSMVIIEDKTGLKKNSLFGNEVEQTQDSIPHFCAKITAGKRAQKTKDFMICARIESLILEQGMEDALERAFAYTAAGADAVMIHSRKKDPAEKKCVRCRKS